MYSALGISILFFFLEFVKSKRTIIILRLIKDIDHLFWQSFGISEFVFVIFQYV